MPPSLPFLLLLLLAFLGGPAVASSQPSPQRLKQLKAQIQQLQTSLTDTRQQRSKTDKALRKTEQRIASLSKRQDTLQEKQATNKHHYQQLQRQQLQQIKSKNQQVVALVELLRERYNDGRQGKLKMLLNQQDPQKMARMLQYQHYIEAARSARVTSLNKSLSALAATSKQLLAAKQSMRQTQQLLNAQHDKLQSAYQQHRQLLAKLDNKIDDKQQHLKRLEANRKQLEKLLRGMQRAIADIPADIGKHPFASLAGRLPWPLPGKLEVQYHSRRSGRVRWDGVVLAAKRGQPVRSIYPGRVVFANWLSGYGQMLIIDQGHGYMTLYGYNQSLTREVGDWVGAGDIIAHAGASGGRRTPGLYFAIRHRGQPVDPDRWCSGRIKMPQ